MVEYDRQDVNYNDVRGPCIYVCARRRPVIGGGENENEEKREEAGLGIIFHVCCVSACRRDFFFTRRVRNLRSIDCAGIFLTLRQQQGRPVSGGGSGEKLQLIDGGFPDDKIKIYLKLLASGHLCWFVYAQKNVQCNGWFSRSTQLASNINLKDIPSNRDDV